jgi:hypothetical protein
MDDQAGADNFMVVHFFWGGFAIDSSSGITAPPKNAVKRRFGREHEELERTRHMEIPGWAARISWGRKSGTTIFS